MNNSKKQQRDASEANTTEKQEDWSSRGDRIVATSERDKKAGDGDQAVTPFARILE